MHVSVIQEVLSNRACPPLSNSFFISHAQAKSADTAGLLALRLELETGFSCWYDQTAANVTEQDMVLGIQSSAIFLLLLSRGIFTRDWVVFEVRAAMQLNKLIIMLCEEDSRFASYGSVSQCFADAPDDIKLLQDINQAMALRRKDYEQMAMIDMMLKLGEMQLASLRHVAQEDRLCVLDPEACASVHNNGKTAACFLDLGTSQMVLYLLSLAPDGSLDQRELLSVPENALQLIKSDRRAMVRAQFVEALSSLADALKSVHQTFQQLYAVKVGATSWYQGCSESETAELEDWVHRLVIEALPTLPCFAFDALAPTHVAQLEWLAIQTAMSCLPVNDPNCPIGSEVHAALSAGGSEVHMSMNQDHVVVDSVLAQAAEMVSREGWAAYENLIMPAFASKFEGIRGRLDHLRTTTKTVRLVVIAGFFYAALACGAVERGNPHFIPLRELQTKARALLHDPKGKAQDKANIVRLLCLLAVVTSCDDSNVEAFCVREWEVHGKSYRATWTTGAFLNDMKLEYARQARARKRPLGRQTTTTSRKSARDLAPFS